MKQDSVVVDGRLGSCLRLFYVACIATLVVFATTELHEAFHFLVGRLVGLPAEFFNLTSAGVEESVAAGAPQSALALMNGVAPLLTVLMGGLALRAVLYVREKAQPLSRRFLPGGRLLGFPTWGCN